MLRMSESLRLDASGSYDPDGASSSQLSFRWSGVQTKPVYNDTCMLSRSITTASHLLLQANADSSNATCVFTVVVADTRRVGRSVQTSVTVSVLGSNAPVVTLVSNSGAVVNSQQRLALAATISLSSSEQAEYGWAVRGIALDKIALLPVNGSIFSSTSINQLVPSHSLTPGQSYVFTLTCRHRSASSHASVTVTVNQSPQSGTFSVSPSSGQEMVDSFRFAAARWQDP